MTSKGKQFQLSSLSLWNFSKIAQNRERKQDVKQLSKKEKMGLLNTVYENVIALNVRQSEDYTRVLSHSIEAFLVYVDDDDQDVYFVAEEGLNKTVKCLIDTNFNRFPAELYRFIKKNGPERSLRCALARFADLIYYIKPYKCRLVCHFTLKTRIFG